MSHAKALARNEEKHVSRNPNNPPAHNMHNEHAIPGKHDVMAAGAFLVTAIRMIGTATDIGDRN